MQMQVTGFFESFWVLIAYTHYYLNWFWFYLYCNFFVPISYSSNKNIAPQYIGDLCMLGVRTEIMRYWTLEYDNLY